MFVDIRFARDLDPLWHALFVVILVEDEGIKLEASESCFLLLLGKPLHELVEQLAVRLVKVLEDLGVVRVLKLFRFVAHHTPLLVAPCNLRPLLYDLPNVLRAHIRQKRVGNERLESGKWHANRPIVARIGRITHLLFCIAIVVVPYLLELGIVGIHPVVRADLEVDVLDLLGHKLEHVEHLVRLAVPLAAIQLEVEVAHLDEPLAELRVRLVAVLLQNRHFDAREQARPGTGEHPRPDVAERRCGDPAVIHTAVAAVMGRALQRRSICILFGPLRTLHKRNDLGKDVVSANSSPDAIVDVNGGNRQKEGTQEIENPNRRSCGKRVVPPGSIGVDALSPAVFLLQQLCPDVVEFGLAELLESGLENHPCTREARRKTHHVLDDELAFAGRGDDDVEAGLRELGDDVPARPVADVAAYLLHLEEVEHDGVDYRLGADLLFLVLHPAHLLLDLALFDRQRSVEKVCAQQVRDPHLEVDLYTVQIYR
mmetsp:Transcript_14609/g.26282  ORF Transcript_14609/g.26282 Transcript_14609/m.26282 type:complete len:484 (+) Transcript_14609:615-2066(+)